MQTELEPRVDRLETLMEDLAAQNKFGFARLERLEKIIEEDKKRAEERMEEYWKRVEEERKKSEEERKRAEERMEEYWKRAEEDRKAMNKKWGELANKMGTLVEDIVAPNIPRIAKEFFGCDDLEFFGVRVVKKHSTDRTKSREFDVIAVCDNMVIVNDTKSTPRRNYINDFIEFVKSKEFYGYFPEYKGKELIPIFASLYLTEDIVKYLTKHKIYAMAMTDETMDIVNFELLKKAKR